MANVPASGVNEASGIVSDAVHEAIGGDGRHDLESVHQRSDRGSGNDVMSHDFRGSVTASDVGCSLWVFV